MASRQLLAIVTKVEWNDGQANARLLSIQDIIVVNIISSIGNNKIPMDRRGFLPDQSHKLG